MKLVIFINSLASGGAERVAATLANHWAAKQWDVTVVTLAAAGTDFYALAPEIKRVSFNLQGDSAHVLTALRQNMRRILALRRAIRQLRPQVALSMVSTSNVLLALACMGMQELCAIGAERSYPPNFPLGRMWESLRSRLYGRLSAVVVLTQEGASWIKEHTTARCVAVIPNAACWPLPERPPRIEPHALCAPERKVLLAVGRLGQEKCFDMLIEVFARLAPQHRQWDLVILGEGPQRPALEAQIRECGMNKRILLPGICGNVGQWYAHADLYVMSSRFEGFPNVLAEAMAYGLPAVSFDCDTGPRDIIRHGIDGLLVPDQDAGELEAALASLMGNSRARQALAARAADVRERFSLEKIAGAWEDLFGKLSSARAAPERILLDLTNEKARP